MVETLNHVGVGTCQLCDHIITANTFTTKACVEIFKIQSEPLNCNSEKVLYLLRCKICDGTPYVGKAKRSFDLRRETFCQHRLETLYPLGLRVQYTSFFLLLRLDFFYLQYNFNIFFLQ